jgi:O-antigen/teichoic acid export membrane protein
MEEADFTQGRQCSDGAWRMPGATGRIVVDVADDAGYEGAGSRCASSAMRRCPVATRGAASGFRRDGAVPELGPRGSEPSRGGSWRSEWVVGSPDLDTAPRHVWRRWSGDGILRRMLGNTLVLLGGKALNALLSLGSMALAVRALGLESYGVLVLIHTFAIAVANVGTFQSWQAILRYGTPALEEGRFGDFGRLVRFTLLLDCGSAIAATGAAVGGAFLVGPLLGWPADVVPIGALYGISVLFMVTATPTGILRLYDRFDLIAMQGSIGSLVRLAGAGIIFLTGGGLREFLLVWFIASAAAGAALFANGFREIRRHGHRGGAQVGWRGLARPFAGIWRFVWSTNFNSTATVGVVHLGTLMTGALLGPAEAGLFRIARQSANALTKPARLLVQVIYPEFARLVAVGDMARLREILLRSLALAGLAAVVCLVTLVLLGPLLLQLIGGDEAQGAYAILLWLGAAALVELWAFPLEPALISTGRAGTALAVRVVAIVVFVPALFLSIEWLELTGAGVATLVAAVVLLFGQLWPTLRLLGPTRT